MDSVGAGAWYPGAVVEGAAVEVHEGAAAAPGPAQLGVDILLRALLIGALRGPSLSRLSIPCIFSIFWKL